MGKRKTGLGNEGAALLFVICCVALVSIIGSLLLVRTTNNHDMKMQEKKAQDAFNQVESGSSELVSSLEVVAQDAIKTAFADLMVNFSQITDETLQKERFAEVFEGALKKELTKTDAAVTLLKKAQNLENPDAVATVVDVNFDSASVLTEGVIGTETKTIRVKDVTFSYQDANGTQSKITTDICVKSAIPNVGQGMSSGILAAFQDFAVISGGNIISQNSDNKDKKIIGNVYAENDLRVLQDKTRMQIYKAGKLLVGGEVQVDNGAELTINNNALKDEDGNYKEGVGLWAGGITIGKVATKDATGKLIYDKNSVGGVFTIDGNAYVADDLTVSDRSSVLFSGNEYVGYGSTRNTSTGNSAVTINTAKDLTLDLGNVKNLILCGSSYIQDRLWGLTAGDVANTMGVLQGESLAYKDMQAMYLVPSECLASGQNPMLRSTFEAYYNEANPASFMTSYAIECKDEDRNPMTIDLLRYIDRNDPFEMRQSVLYQDGGTYVYVYLKFKSEKEASAFFNEYIRSSKGESIKKQIVNLGNSKVILAQKNYTVSNLFRYDYTLAESLRLGFVKPDPAVTVKSTKGTNAARRYTGLFSSLRDNTVSATPGNVVGNILNRAAIDSMSTVNDWGSENIYLAEEDGFRFYVHKGDLEINGSTAQPPSGTSGILIVDGDLEIKAYTNYTFYGLILATGDVKLHDQLILNADENAVQKLLENDTVMSFFKGLTIGSSSSEQFLSSKAVDISFENWKKN